MRPISCIPKLCTPKPCSSNSPDRPYECGLGHVNPDVHCTGGRFETKFTGFRFRIYGPRFWLYGLGAQGVWKPPLGHQGLIGSSRIRS